MATVNQEYELLNTVQEMAYGETAIDVIDTSSFVALGTKVLSSDTNKDLFVNTIFDRIGITLNDTRLYSADDNNVIRRQFDFGCALQKLHVEPAECRENPEWLIGENDFTPEYAPVLKPVVKQKIFADMVTYECGVTVPDNMLKTAFINEVNFGAFLVALTNSLEVGLELAKERAIDITRATMIAYVLKANSANSIDLLKRYNDTLPVNEERLTADQYLKTPEALSDGAMVMSLTADRMSRANKIFNNEEYTRFTPKDLLRVDILNVFDYAIKYGLRPVVYNEKFIQLPNYKLVPYWLGIDEDYNFDGISTIAISKDDGKGGTETVANQSGVVGVMYDVEACGVNIFGEESAFDRNDHAHYTTHYRQMTAQYYVDSSEQCVVFYLSDPQEPVPPVSRSPKINMSEEEAKKSVKKLAKALATTKE